MSTKRAARRDNHDEGVGAAWARLKLGTMLREDRKRAGMTQEEAAEVTERHVTTIHKMENGLPGVRFKLDGDIQKLGNLYGTAPERIEAEKKLVGQTRAKGPYQRYKDVTSPEFDLYLGLEGDAEGIVSFDNELIPGQLQTEAYALAINSLPGVDGRPRSQDEIEKRVALRLARQAALTRDKRPLRIDAILNENVLRLHVGGPELMIGQLRHLVEMSELPNISVRVVPTSTGLHLGFVTGQFIVLRFPGDQPPSVYCDTYLGGNYLKEPEEIRGYEQAFSEISRHALTEEDSRAFIEQVAKELAGNA